MLLSKNLKRIFSLLVLFLTACAVPVSAAASAEGGGQSAIGHFFADHWGITVFVTVLFLAIFHAFIFFRRKAYEEQDKQLLARVKAEIVDSLTGCTVIILLHPQTDEYQTVYRQRRPSESCYPINGFYSEAMDTYISTDVHRYDREMLRRDAALEKIDEELKNKKEYAVIFRDISEGVSHWIRMRAIKISETEVLVGFANYDEQYIDDAIREKLEEDAYALFVVNVDTGMLTIAKKSPWDPKWPEGEKVPYSDVISSIAGKYTGEVKEFYTKLSGLTNIRKYFDTKDKFTYTYKSQFVENNPWVIVNGRVVIRHTDTTPAVFVLLFSLLNSESIEKAELQKKLAEAVSIIREEKNRFDIVNEIIHAGQWLIRFNDKDMVTGIEYFFDDENLRRFKLSKNPREWKNIPLEDRKALLHSIRETITDHSGKTIFDVNYRMFGKDGSCSYLRSAGKAVRNEDGSGEVFGILFDVTERVKREQQQQEKLKQVEEAQKLIDNISRGYDVVYVVNMADDSVDIRKVTRKMIEFGHQFENFSECREFFCTEVLHPRDRERMERELDFAVIRRHLAEKPSYSMEYSTIINGTTYGSELNVTAIDEDKIIIGMAHGDLELTKRHLEEKHYKEYFALFIIDLDTEMIRAFKNESGYKISKTGRSVPYTPAVQSFAETLTDADAKAFFMEFSDLDALRRELATDDKRTFSYKSDNTGKWVTVTAYVIQRKADGAPAVVTLGFGLADSLEADRQETQALMKQQMETISGLASEYTALYHVNLDTGEYNPYYVAEKIEDIKPHIERNRKYIGLYNDFVDSAMVHEDSRKSLRELYPSDEALKAKLVGRKNLSLQFLRNYSGTFLWTEVNIIKCEAISEPARMVVVGFKEVDAAVRARMEQQRQLEEAVKSAEVANKSKTSFLFNMSHDIRTPMNAIKGFTTMAKKYLGDRERVEDYLEKIDVSGHQLLGLVNQVLEMSRIESGKIDFDNKPVNIMEKFNSMVVILAAQASDNGQEFTYANNITHFNVLADEAKMGQITLNIAGNALKYTPKGGKISFRLREIPCEKEGWGRYVFTVADTGIGMSEEYLKVLFEPFSREKTSTVSHIQGTGLGMSIVKKLVDLMGGKIEVQSAPGRGTRFDITIDFELTDEATGQLPAESAKQTSFKGKRVLLVEDNELNREIAKDILEEFGIIVEEAEDGDVAVEMVENAYRHSDYGYYDLVLMDIQMPRMNGYEATGAIRALGAPKGTRLPIIAMTANAFAEDRKNALEAGMDAHLAKPIEIDKLQETLSRYL